MTLKIEMPAGNPMIMRHLGEALLAIADEMAQAPAGVETPLETAAAAGVLDETTVKPGWVAPTAETATAAATTTASEPNATVSTEVDPKGVVFDDNFCGKADVPFYASGPNKQQWKKKRGVTEEQYSAWYAGELGKVALTDMTASDTTTQAAEINTAAAFSAPQSQTTAPQGEPAPTDCGTFMGWVSAQQAAGLLTQESVATAYKGLGLVITDLFPPNSPELVAQHVANLHGTLTQMAAQA